ncbi:hypothetical protein [Paenibacillus thiaminolyticus]|uniref:hypothetical protein n=1 Tax=Paenibacillus thiaminolyticus TaxID=49283 RepID=UPI001F107AE3|nr:hypothetical protein [Paenibacillus thiaminolyticus]
MFVHNLAAPQFIHPQLNILHPIVTAHDVGDHIAKLFIDVERLHEIENHARGNDDREDLIRPRRQLIEH